MEDLDQTPRRIDVGEVLTPQELLQFPFFKGVSEKLLQKNLGAVVRRRFKKGEIICREGEDGTTAFYILEGKVDVCCRRILFEFQQCLAAAPEHIGIGSGCFDLAKNVQRLRVFPVSEQLPSQPDTPSKICGIGSSSSRLVSPNRRRRRTTAK